MKRLNILHLCIQDPYNDYWGYQDNLLPKYHRKMGHNVTVITTTIKHGDNGRIVSVPAEDYELNDGQRIIRLEHIRFFPVKISAVLRIYSIYDLICEIKPDLIMVHALSNISILKVVKYVKTVNQKCVVIADNHQDYFNTRIKNKITSRALRLLYKILNLYMQRYYKKVYGVTPWRVKYMQEVFNIKPEKSDLLVMGGDDEFIDFKNQSKIRSEIRAKHNIKEDDFLIVTGGKIDKTKNIHLLMKAVSEMKPENVKLIVFGSPKDEIREKIEELSKNKKTRSIGWIKAEETYNYFLASDLVVFPGTHSVLFEQVCACGIPAVFKYWEGMEHLDVGGNCKFLYEDSVEEIKKVLSEIIANKELYDEMKKVAVEKGVNKFLYSKIAEKSLETVLK